MAFIAGAATLFAFMAFIAGATAATLFAFMAFIAGMIKDGSAKQSWRLHKCWERGCNCAREEAGSSTAQHKNTKAIKLCHKHLKHGIISKHESTGLQRAKQ